LIDRVKVLRPTRQKQVISDMFYSASVVTTIWRYTNVYIIIIIILPSQSLGTKKLKQTQQIQTSIHNKIYYNRKWTKKTTARFGRLLRPPAWKRNRVYSGRSR